MDDLYSFDVEKKPFEPPNGDKDDFREAKN
jgi:hypothetical protein